MYLFKVSSVVDGILALTIDNGRNIEMKFTEKEKKFDPEKIYKGQPNPTKI